MRREREFLQRRPEADGGTLHKASTRAFAKKGYSGTTQAQKAKIFRDDAGNIMTLFFIGTMRRTYQDITAGATTLIVELIDDKGAATKLVTIKKTRKK